MHVVPGGREWLARQMDARGIGYLRRDNCFLQISEFEGAQKLADQQPRIKWRGQLSRLLRRVHPLHTQFFGGDCALDYHGSGGWQVAGGKWERRRPYHLPLALATSSEWATDVVFRDAGSLSRLYQRLVRRGIDTFQSPDVLRFLGHKVPAHGGVQGRYQGEVMSDVKRRTEGVRIKHRAGKNTVKMYNKEPTLITADMPLSELTDKFCQRVEVNGRRHRGLRPFDPEDVQLLQAVSLGEYFISGFRNRDIRKSLYGETDDAIERRRQSGRVSRKLAMLRAHGLIKKIPRTHRYLLTQAGINAITAILSARQASVSQLVAA
jgi:hypothetical protein